MTFRNISYFTVSFYYIKRILKTVLIYQVSPFSISKAFAVCSNTMFKRDWVNARGKIFLKNGTYVAYFGPENLLKYIYRHET